MAVSRRLARLNSIPARAAAILLAILLFALAIPAEQSRITQAVDNGQRVALRGHIHPSARAEFDQGRVAPGMRLSSVTIQLAPTAAQQADLERLLKSQQTPGSPD